jgi:aspartyl-tRNA(Asn)/glutamyl-tRNA(Gln) amidotransferase subunit B
MPVGSDTFGTRAELKNLNSFRNVEKALHYEIMRQREVIEDGGAVVQETRLWNPDRGVTTSMRGKEEAHDYRYFPDPDLLPVVVDDAWIQEIEAGLPELPDEKEQRFVGTLGLSAYDAGVLTADRELADYFEACLESYDRPKPVANWIMGPLLGRLNAEGETIAASPVAPADLAALLKLVDDGTISGKIAKTVFDDMAATGKAPGEIVTEKQLVQLSDTSAIEKIIDEVIASHPDEVAAFRGGRKKLMGFFVGQVMKATQGKANPKMVNEILQQKLQ